MSSTLDELLVDGGVRLDARAVDREDAVRQAAALLQAGGAVGDGYADAMLDREHSVSTYLGGGVAVPHGTRASASLVRRDAIVLLRLPDGVDWAGEDTTLVIGLAASNSSRIGLLAQLAARFLDPTVPAALRQLAAADVAGVARLLRDGASA